MTENEKRIAENIAISTALMALFDHNKDAREHLRSTIENVGEMAMRFSLSDDQIALVQQGLRAVTAQRES